MGDTKYPPEWVDAIKALYPCKVMYGYKQIAVFFSQEEHKDAAKAMCLIQGLRCTENGAFISNHYPFSVLVSVDQTTLFT